MYVILLIQWDVEIEYRLNIIYVDSSSCHIGSNQYSAKTFSELTHHLVTLRLRKVTVKCFSKNASSTQRFSHLIRHTLGIAKHHA